MKPYLNQIIEMAKPRKEDIAKRYYHGTSNKGAGESILKNGIQPPDLTLKKKHKLTPREGKVYITPHIVYAQIHAMGGDLAGSDYLPQDYAEHKYGYLFVIDGKDILDLEPDEDSIGEILHSIAATKSYVKEYNTEGKDLQWLKDLALRYLTSYQLNKVMRYDDYADFAVAGKKLISHMTDTQKLQLIDCGAHIAHHGAIKPIEAWRLDFADIPKLKPDGSNFFKVTERIK